jgi:hypothetical protein
MAVKLITKKAGQATVTKDTKKQGQTIAQEMTQEEVGEPKILEGPTCNVGVDASFTKNLGNYESLRLGVSLHLPCYHNEIDEVFEFGKEWVNRKMEGLIGELDNT